MRIDVHDFQSIGQASIDAQGLTVLVGPSDRGKSALIRAVESALFNRTGDGFVRLGQPFATVALELGDPATAIENDYHVIEWTKGGGYNKFKVDGIEFAKVGAKAPPVLQEIGFRDEVIGGRVKDDGKLEGGELMRPQVARQFDSIFLLDKPGSFLNEVMVKLSRLSVLQRANRTCTADLRQAKTTLAVRRGDALAAREAADQLRPVVEIRERLTELAACFAAMEQARQRMEQLIALVARRREVVRLAQVELPDAAPLRAEMSRTSLQGGNVNTLRLLVTQRGQLRARLTGFALPGALRMPKKWWAAADAVPQLQRLLGDRRKAALRVVELPTRKIKKSAADAIMKYQTLQPLMIDQRQHRNWVDQYESVAARKVEDHDQLSKAFADLKKQVRTCPVCERPF